MSSENLAARMEQIDQEYKDKWDAATRDHGVTSGYDLPSEVQQEIRDWYTEAMRQTRMKTEAIKQAQVNDWEEPLSQAEKAAAEEEKRGEQAEKPKRGRKASPEVAERNAAIIEKFQEGVARKKLAEEFGVSYPIVAQVLAKAGLGRPKKAKPQEPVTEGEPPSE